MLQRYAFLFNYMLISKKSDRIPVDFTSSGEFSSRGICHPISKTPPRTGGSGHPEPEWHDSYFICSLWAATHHRLSNRHKKARNTPTNGYILNDLIFQRFTFELFNYSNNIL